MTNRTDHDDALERQYVPAFWPGVAVKETVKRWNALGSAFREASKVKADIAYGDSDLQKLDLYLPKRDGAPVLVFIHGGYWRNPLVNRVSLRAGQTITLNIGDIGPNPAAPTNDLDLFLFDADPFDINNPAGISLGVGNTETVDVPADDTYLVLVFAFDGASNYVLSVGQGTATAAAGRTPAGLGSGHIVPGEARVRWKQPTPWPAACWRG